MKKSIALTLCAAFFSIVGCNSSDSTDPRQSALDANQTKWANANVDSYSITVSRICFCPVQEAIVKTVTNGTVTNAFYTPSGTVLDPAGYARSFTIEDYFGSIQTGIDEDYEVLDVEYDPTYGFPKKIVVDHGPEVVDEEYTLYIRDFQ